MINLGVSPLLTFAFMMLTMAVVAGWFVGVWVSSGTIGLAERTRSARLIQIGFTTLVWMVTVILLAASGVLLHFDWRPPPMVLLIVASLGVAAWIGFSKLGHQLAMGLPLASLVAFQAFRWPLELIMHRGFQQGFVPIQMTRRAQLRHRDRRHGGHPGHYTRARPGIVADRTSVERDGPAAACEHPHDSGAVDADASALRSGSDECVGRGAAIRVAADRARRRRAERPHHYFPAALVANRPLTNT